MEWNTDADLLDIWILHLTGLSCHLTNIGEGDHRSLAICFPNASYIEAKTYEEVRELSSGEILAVTKSEQTLFRHSCFPRPIST
jgi:hypothetical protein